MSLISLDLPALRLRADNDIDDYGFRPLRSKAHSFILRIHTAPLQTGLLRDATSPSMTKYNDMNDIHVSVWAWGKVLESEGRPKGGHSKSRANRWEGTFLLGEGESKGNKEKTLFSWTAREGHIAQHDRQEQGRANITRPMKPSCRGFACLARSQHLTSHILSGDVGYRGMIWPQPYSKIHSFSNFTYVPT